jgi:flavin reductase (DIM6/NTAB) family NADH-FMN oxidoreductase RutF
VTSPGQLRDLLRRLPTGVAVLTVEVRGTRVGLTVATLVSLSLEPPLVGVAISRQAAIHELVHEARSCAVSLLAAGQQAVAEHFARGVPPIAMWQGVATRESGDGAPLLEGALGWLVCRVSDSLVTGTHTLFVLEVLRAERGAAEAPLVRLGGAFA